MTDKFNGRTPYEIKRGLVDAIEEASWVVEGGDAHDLIDAVEKAHASMADALAYIQQLEHERDAAVEDMTELMKMAQSCRYCKHLTEDGDCTFDHAAHIWQPWCWQWRGVQEVE